jgi:hypothetical protein
LAPSCTSQRHGQIFSSPCACVHDFRLLDALHIGWQFGESSSISNTYSSLGFGILLLPRWILLVFLMLILLVVERRHHFLKDHVEKGDIEMRYIDTER